MLAIGSAVRSAGSSTAFLRTFHHRRGSALANRGLYYIRSTVLTFKFRHIRERLDERAVHERVVHDGYIVKGIIVFGVHIVYHTLSVILKGKAVTGAIRPCYRLAIFVLSLTTLITVILQVHRLLSLLIYFVFLFYL